MKKFNSIIATAILWIATTGSAWSAAPNYTWTTNDYLDDNGITLTLLNNTHNLSAGTIDVSTYNGKTITFTSFGYDLFGQEKIRPTYNGKSYYGYLQATKSSRGHFIIPGISGSGTLTLVVDKRSGCSVKVYSANDLVMNDETCLGEGLVKNSVTIGTQLTTVSVNLSGLLNEDLKLRFDKNLSYDLTAKIYDVIWEPTSYFWDFKEAVEKYGEEQTTANGELVSSSCQIDAFVEVPAHQSMNGKYLKINPAAEISRNSGKYTYSFSHGIRTSSNGIPAIYTDAITATYGGNMYIYYQSANNGTFSITDYETGALIASKAYTSSGSLCEVGALGILNNRRLKIAANTEVTIFAIELDANEGMVTSYVDYCTKPEASGRKIKANANRGYITISTNNITSDPTSTSPKNCQSYKGTTLYYRAKELNSDHEFFKWTTDAEGIYQYKIDDVFQSSSTTTGKSVGNDRLYAQFRYTDEEPISLSGVSLAKVANGCEGWGNVEMSADRVISGQKIAFTATPNDGYRFIGWTWAGQTTPVTDNPIIYTTPSAYAYSANFEEITYSYTADFVTGESNTHGEIETWGYRYVDNPDYGKEDEPEKIWMHKKIDNSGTTTYNDSLEFKAGAKSGGKFVGWFSDAAGTNLLSSNPSYKVNITDEDGFNIYAKFISADNAKEFHLNTVGAGIVTTNNNSFSNGQTLSNGLMVANENVVTYEGEHASFTAKADDGYCFNGWTLDGTNLSAGNTSLYTYAGGREITLNFDANDHTLVANFRRDGRAENLWEGDPNDWVIGNQTSTNRIGIFTFRATSTSQTSFGAATVKPEYNGTTYNYMYSIKKASDAKGNYIYVANNRAASLTMVVRNPGTSAVDLKVFENKSDYNTNYHAASTVSIPAGQQKIVTLSINLAAPFVIGTTGALDIYMMQAQKQYTVTVKAENGDVTSTVTKSLDDVNLETKFGLTAVAWGKNNSDVYKTNGTIQTVPTQYYGQNVTTRNGDSAPLVENYFTNTNICSNIKDIKTVLMQEVTGLENGAYQVTVYANAYYSKRGNVSGTAATNGGTNYVWVFANETNQFIPVHNIGNSTQMEETEEYTLQTYVTDGKLKVGMRQNRNGANWFTIQIKSVDQISLWSEDLTDQTGAGLATYNSVTENYTQPSTADWSRKSGYTNAGTKYYNGINVPERYRNSDSNETGDMIYKTFQVPQGTYTIKLYANSCNTLGDVSGKPTDGNTGYAKVYANSTERNIPTYNTGGTERFQEITLTGVQTNEHQTRVYDSMWDWTGHLETDYYYITVGINKIKRGTNWHCIQVLSMKNQSTGIEYAPTETGSRTIDEDYISTPTGDATRKWQRKAISQGGMNFQQVPDIGNDGGSSWVFRNDGTQVMMAERWADHLSGTGKMLWQVIPDLPSGTYEVTLYASSCNTGDRDKFADYTILPNGDETFTYVYANDTKYYIPSYRSSSMVTYDEIKLNAEVADENDGKGTLEVGIYADKNGTNWHCIQIKSLYYKVGTKKYNENEIVNMVATPHEGYRFTGWTLDGSVAGNGDQTLNFIVTKDHNVVANFEEDTRDDFVWEAEPLDWVYGTQTSSKTLGIYTFKSGTAASTQFEKNNDADVEYNNEERKNRFRLTGASATGGRYLVVNPNEAGKLTMLVRNPSESSSATISFYANRTAYTTGTASKTESIAKGATKTVTYNYTSESPFVIEANRDVEIYILRYKTASAAANEPFEAPTFAYDYESKQLTIVNPNDAGNIYYSTSSNVTASTGTRYTGAITVDMEAGEEAASMTYYAVVSQANGSQQSDEAEFAIGYYPEKSGYCQVNTGDVASLKAALAYANAAASAEKRIKVFIPWGQYDLGDESIMVGNYVSLIGEDNLMTCITSSNENQTLLVSGDYAYVQDLLLVNSGAGSVIRDKGTANVYYNDSLVGTSKVFYTDGKWKQCTYVDSCGFKGEVDVVCGTGTVYFDHCYFDLGENGTHLSAQKTDARTLGHIFNECTAYGRNKYTIARPWDNAPAATWINSKFSGIYAANGFGSGYKQNLNIRYHEYNCVDGDGHKTKDIPFKLTDCHAKTVDGGLYNNGNYVLNSGFNSASDYATSAKKIYGSNQSFYNQDPATLAAQKATTAATKSGWAVAWESESDATAYIVEAFTEAKPGDEYGDVYFTITDEKAIFCYMDQEDITHMTVRSANGRGGFGDPILVTDKTEMEEPETKLVQEVTLNGYGYLNYSCGGQIQVVGATACKAWMDQDTKLVKLSVVDNGRDIVPAQTGVVLFGEPYAKVKIYENHDTDDLCTSTENWVEGTHNLKPNVSRRSVQEILSAYGYPSGAVYGLSGNTWARYKDTGNVGSNKSIFVFPSGLSNAATFRIVWSESDIDGVENIESTDILLDDVFDITGRKTDDEKGLIIKGGKVILNR